MKKVFTTLFSALAVCASAQQVGQIVSGEILDANGAALTTDAADVNAGTVLATTESAVMTLLNADPTKKMTTGVGNFSSIKVGDAELSGKDGVTGSTNPVAPTILENATQAGTYLAFEQKGFVPTIEVKADGFIYALGKLTLNKNYYVLEYTTANGFAAGVDEIAYTLAGVAPDVTDGILGNDKGYLKYTVAPANEEGYYTGKADIPNVEQIVLGSTYDEATGAWNTEAYTAAIAASSAWAEAGKIGKNVFGVIKFPVYKDMSYAVFGRGTKISISGFIFSEKDLDVTAIAPEKTAEDGTVTPGDEVVLIEGNAASDAVKVVKAAQIDENAPVYNLQGQRVNKGAKGVFVQNGKIIVVK